MWGIKCKVTQGKWMGYGKGLLHLTIKKGEGEERKGTEVFTYGLGLKAQHPAGLLYPFTSGVSSF
jgi:hypothetical protein